MRLKQNDLRHGLVAAMLTLLAALAFAQDNAAEDAEPDEEAAAAEADSVDGIDDPELDAQGFDPTADDDFVPSEDIPADAPIAFPTDI